MIQTYLIQNCLSKLPHVDAIYQSIVLRTDSRSGHVNRSSSSNHMTDGRLMLQSSKNSVNSNNNNNINSSSSVETKLLSELLISLWNTILFVPPPPLLPDVSSFSNHIMKETTSTTNTNTTNALISSVIQQYNSSKVAVLPPPLPASSSVSTTTIPLPHYHTNETIRSYMHRIVHDHILHQILIPVIQQVYHNHNYHPVNHKNNNTNKESLPPSPQILQSSIVFMNTMASSINYTLLMLLSIKDETLCTHHHRMELVRLVRDLIHYLQTHPPPLLLSSSSTTHCINPLSESLLKYCTNISFLHDIGIMTTTGKSQSHEDANHDVEIVKRQKVVVDQLVSKRLRMINTALHYRQYKFNLFVEESEGYTKFLHYLLMTTTTVSPSMTKMTTIAAVGYDEIYKSLHSIMGTFYLDPNRCMDIVIDTLEYECFGPSDSLPLLKSILPVSLLESPHDPAVVSDHSNPQQQLRLLRYIYILSILNTTTKLPQLMGYKLWCRQRRMKQHDTTNRPVLSMSSFHAAVTSTTTTITHSSASGKASIHNNDPTDRNVSCDISSLLHCTAWLCLQPQYVPHWNMESHNSSSDRGGNIMATTEEMTRLSETTTRPIAFLLDPKMMLSYMPDDDTINKTDTKSSTAATTTTAAATSYEEILEYVYHQHVVTEKARIRNVGRVSLTSNQTMDTTTETTILSPNDHPNYTIRTIEEHCITQWIAILIQNQQFTSSIQNLLSNSHWSMLSVLLPHTIGVAILDNVQTHVTSFLSAINAGTSVTSTITPWSSSSTSFGNSTANVVPTIEAVLGIIVDPLMFTMESGCIAMRPTLYCQLCRLLTFLIKSPIHELPSSDSDEDVAMSESTPQNDSTNTAARKDLLSKDLLHFLQSYLVPCLSSYHSNPAISMELWNVIQALPYSARYSLYAAWRGTGIEQRSALVSTEVAVSKPLWLIEGELRTGKDIRYALKRISKDTIRDMSRSVAKCCHGHPLVVFTTILNQIESYDNLVQVMVDACRFVTPLSLDVLGYCILQRLSDSNDDTSESRSRLKANGVNVSQWLQSLEIFTGAFYKRFPYVEFQGLLFYLLQRLKDGHVMELGVLRTLLKNGAGWSFADYSPAESLSMTQLEGRAGSTRLKRETMTFGVVSDINLSASNEVRRVLHNNNIGVSLLILLTQVRHSIIFQKSKRSIPVKLIGNLVDTSQVVMSILLDFLTNEVDHDGAEIGPTSTAIHEYASSLPTLVELQEHYKVEVASSWTLCRPLMRAARSVKESDIKLKKHLSSLIPCASLAGMASKSVWKHLTTELFEFFFSASAYDIFCPCDVYENEILRLERETERLSQKKNAPPPMSIQPGAIPEKSDREEYERVKQMVIGLNEDHTTQKKHVASTHEKFLSKIPNMFVSDTVTVPSAVTFFTRCIFPRCMQGPDDALYCARFVSLMHQNNTPGFGTLHYVDALIQILPRSLYCLTEGEAACASILLFDTWKTISRWRYDDMAFESELIGTPGSFIATDTTSDPVKVTKKDYENLYNKWHAAIGDTLVGCLHSKEYIHLRCGLIVLTRIVDEFPTRPILANSLLDALEPLKDESNTFADIRASSQAYSMQLLRSRDNGVWKEEDAATVQARLASVEAAAMERQKKAQEQMEQIERDSEKITSKIGISETRGRGRGPTLLRSNSDERLNRSNVVASDANRRRTATASGPIDDGFRGGGSSSANSGGGGGFSFSSYASIAPTNQGGESLANLAGRTLDGRWQHSSSGTTPPRNPGSTTTASTASNVAATNRSGTASSNTINTRKRGRVSSSPTNPSEQQNPDESSSSKRSKVSQSENESKRSRTRHNTGSRRT